MTDILYPSKSRRFMSEVAGVRRYHRNSGRAAAAARGGVLWVAVCKDWSCNPTAWPPSSPSWKDRSVSHEGRLKPLRNNRPPPDLRVSARLHRSLWGSGTLIGLFQPSQQRLHVAHLLGERRLPHVARLVDHFKSSASKQASSSGSTPSA